MSPSPAWLSDVAAHASTLAERLAGQLTLDDRGGGETPATDRWRRWCDTVGAGDLAFVERSLRWDRTTADEMRRALGRPAWPSDVSLPPWTALLADALDALQTDEGGGPDRALDAASPVAFEQLLVAFVQAARRRVATRVGPLAARFDDRAHAAFEGTLLRELASVADQSLYLEYAVARARPARAGASRHAAGYRAFVDAMRRGGLLGTFARYPVLARLLATRTLFWVDAMCELLERLAADSDRLDAAFGAGQPLGMVCDASAGLSDSHHHGRSVSILRFASGVRVVYKPRSLGMDRAFGRLVDWVNRSVPGPSLWVPAVLDRESYGWMEYAERRSCHTPLQVEHFYERGGMLLALAYVFGGADLHVANLIAMGEFPVPIDFELLCTPRAAEYDRSDTRARASDRTGASMWRSVYRTGLLPQMQVARGGLRMENGGLAGALPAPGIMLRRWRHVNTDFMGPEQWHKMPRDLVTVPLLAGEFQYADAYVPAIERGFRTIYDLLMRDGRELAHGPLQAMFADAPVRVLLRPTRVYDALVKASTHPALLADGTDRSIHLAILRRSFGSADEVSRYWSVLATETEQLVDLDVPHFTTRAGGRDLSDATTVVAPKFCRRSGLDDVRSVLLGLSNADRELQVAHIQHAFAALATKITPALAACAQPPRAAAPPLSASAAIDEAGRIARELAHLAGPDRDATPTWLMIRRASGRTPGGLVRVDAGLYEGRCGIALFLAAYERVSGDATHRVLLEATLRPVVRAVQRPRALRTMARRAGIGAGTGLGGIAYALTTIARLLDVPSYAAAGRAAALACVPGEALAAGRDIDALSGVAGAMLALLALDPNDAAALDGARACGRQLAGHFERSADGQAWSWREAAADVLGAGFAHGTAGIGYAIERLAARLEPMGEGEFSALARATLHARAGRPTSAGIAPHVQHQARDTATTKPSAWSWCHGGSGRLMADVVSTDAAVVRDALAGITATVPAADDVGSIDHLCCGSFGVVELLTTAAAHANRPDLLDAARARAGHLVARARRASTYAFEHQDGVMAPGFFQGQAGIGYSLLRTAAPDVLPSVLLWQ